MILDGKKVAHDICSELKDTIAKLDTPPKLGVILVGDNPESVRYIDQKKRACKEVGMGFELFQFPAESSEFLLLQKMDELNCRKDISGYLVQLPLPTHINTLNVIRNIIPLKDVDGFTPENQGKVVIADPTGNVPCTPMGVMKLCEAYGIEFDGKKVCILGQSNIVGKPMANLCMNAGATVISCNSHTPDIARYTQDADIIITATGVPHLLQPDMVQPDCSIIDVGFTVEDDGKVYGDADFEALLAQGNTITPVPGGVGPMTVCMLLVNTYHAALQQ